MRQLMHDLNPRYCPNDWLVKSFQAIPGSSKVVFPKGRHDMQVKSFSQKIWPASTPTSEMHGRECFAVQLCRLWISSQSFGFSLRDLPSTMQLWILHSTHTRANEFLQCSFQLVLGWESNTNQRRPSEWTSVRKVLTLKQPNMIFQALRIENRSRLTHFWQIFCRIFQALQE